MRQATFLTLVIALLFAGALPPVGHTHDRPSHHRRGGVSFGHTHWSSAESGQPVVTRKHHSTARSVQLVAATAVGKYTMLVALVATDVTGSPERTYVNAISEPAPRGNDPPGIDRSAPRGPPLSFHA